MRRDGVMVRSLNAGHRGFGPAQELKVLRRMLGRFHIDAVVVQSFPMNDFSDNIAYGAFGVSHGALMTKYVLRRPGSRWRALLAYLRGLVANLRRMRRCRRFR